MKQMSIEEVSFAVNGSLVRGKNVIRSVSINSNDIKNGALFVPIKGEKVDAHKFINDALKKGASASFSEKSYEMYDDKPIIMVKDSIKALQDLSEYYRMKFDIPVVGVTGSVGKTTTKEMIYSALSEVFNVSKTAGNLNGQLGVPLTVFNIEDNTDIAVIEMGISKPGEMGKISKIVRPNIAVINNIGISHLEELLSRENILSEKLHVIDYFNPNDVLIFNGDNDILSKADLNMCKTISFGIKNKCDCCAENIKMYEDKILFRLNYKDINTEIVLPVLGLHNVYNALSSIAVAVELGVDIKDIKKGLLKYTNPKMRQQIYTIGNIDIIDDSYNASPDSVEGAIDLLKKVSNNKISIAVLADMLELGEKSEEAHVQIGKYLSENKIDKVITVGNLSSNIKTGLDKSSKIQSFLTNKEALQYLIKHIPLECTVLIKGSRGMKMDQVASSLIKELENRNEKRTK